MKANFLKSKLYGLFNMKLIIGAFMVLMVTIVAIIISQMGEREEIYLEGMVKGTPLLREDRIKILGDKYTELEMEFERQIKEYEEATAPLPNKCGEYIRYGVNGKENCDEMINNDYVNGIIVTYEKGGADERKDGDSNFIDMLAVLSTALGSKIDNIEEDKLIEMFSNLFWASHTFSGHCSDEMYSCTHGCRWIKYYCGDNIVNGGDMSGDSVGYKDVDSYMGLDGVYAMKYNPFLVSEYSYPMLDDYIDEWWKNSEVAGGDDEYFTVARPVGSCDICEKGKSLRETTKAYRGCVTPYKCYHGSNKVSESCDSEDTEIKIRTPYGGTARVEKEEEEQWIVENHNMGSEPVAGCLNYAPIAIEYKSKDADSDSEGPKVGDPVMIGEDEEEGKEGYQKLDKNGKGMIIMGSGYYECMGHSHYKCYGHILCCCMGHRNLYLTVKIMYHKEMLEKMAEIIK